MFPLLVTIKVEWWIIDQGQFKGNGEKNSLSLVSEQKYRAAIELQSKEY